MVWLCKPVTEVCWGFRGVSILSTTEVMAQSAGDRRRINGPEESFSPIFDDDEEDIILKTQRIRAPGDIRPICESQHTFTKCR